MRDLAGYDRSPSAFLVYLYLCVESERAGGAGVRASHQTIAESADLSKSAAQKAVRALRERKPLRVQRESPTATPEYRALRSWRR